MVYPDAVNELDLLFEGHPDDVSLANEALQAALHMIWGDFLEESCAEYELVPEGSQGSTI